MPGALLTAKAWAVSAKVCASGRCPVRERAWCGTLGVVAVDARVEHVGSLLRPQFLRDARDAYAQGVLTPAGFKTAEDRSRRTVCR